MGVGDSRNELFRRSVILITPALRATTSLGAHVNGGMADSDVHG
jgi:hypothetical protein